MPVRSVSVSPATSTVATSKADSTKSGRACEYANSVRGCGGQLLVVDFRSFQYVALGYVVASAIRPVLSFLIGGMIIHYIYLDERHPGKLFYAGMAAPALIFALANRQKVDLNPSAQQPSATQQKKAGNLRVIYPGAWAMSWAVYAADTAQLKTFGPPQEGFAQQLLRGIVGDVPKNVYFAIAGSYRTLAWAQCWLGDVRVKFPTAEVYGPSGGNNLYSIVIGPQLTIEEAQKEVKDALLFGFADAYVWRRTVLELAPVRLVRPA